MKASELIDRLIKIKADIGDYPIQVSCEPNTETLTVALWADNDGDCEPYIKAIDMGEMNESE